MDRGISRPGGGTALVTALSLCAFAGAAAQETPRRAGQWIAVGVGPGLDQIACEVCSAEPQPGVAAHVRVGGTASSRLLLGGELDVWVRSAQETRQYLVSLGAVGLLYGGADARFHLKGGVAAVGYRAEADGDALTAFTPGAIGGIGYDLPVAREVSLTPFATLTLAPYANLRFNGDPSVDGATLTLLQAGLGVTWH